MKRLTKKYRLLILFLCMLLPLMGCSVKKTEGLRVYFPSLGQGDCTVFVTPGGKTVAVDAGPAGSSDDLHAFLLRQKIKTVDLLILTHAHADHVGGAAAIFDFCTVKNVWYTPEKNGSSSEDELLDAIRKSGARLSDAAVGISGTFDGLSLSVILRPTDASDPNGNSAIVRAVYGGTSFLLMADAGADAEKQLLAEKPELLRADLLKVGHHGSDSGCTGDFLGAVSPSWAVVCCGIANVYAHPHRRCLEALEKAGCRVFLTSNGTQEFRSDGQKVYRIE